ncbi:hypothetical protein KP509_21G014800 [Ceratopteris richardii]|uniref:Uncharacterized protein n=1 Tax=Ceratopteris richardii TaxID=49495 RepID=A0A8T2S8V9_CERRI|nr:hypothetical protein KP509_21G013600 [Ceratopteris richardii]KAH7314665.1 hypothetical protein KP509_21G014000 [Ceratopteris richardii]KAH7314671.1 hypothetical protein KP509_21G014600 [Ceratopteris richardii]KAH7314673.1 hypothetical protein KP509_21G014800 [Ceratopteris richardii]
MKTAALKQKSGGEAMHVLFWMAAALLVLMAAEGESYSDNCDGSGLCGCCVSQNDCRNAFARYTDGTIYSGYTSRVSGHCTAIFQCDGSYPSVSGAVLKQQFLHIYQNQPCQKCGSHAFNGNCEATLNYCASCRDSGNPN